MQERTEDTVPEASTPNLKLAVWVSLHLVRIQRTDGVRHHGKSAKSSCPIQLSWLFPFPFPFPLSSVALLLVLAPTSGLVSVAPPHWSSSSSISKIGLLSILTGCALLVILAGGLLRDYGLVLGAIQQLEYLAPPNMTRRTGYAGVFDGFRSVT